jgi:microcystin-dependent protein
VTLTTNQIPAHNHAAAANTAIGTQAGPGNDVLAGAAGVSRYVNDPPATAMSNQSVSIAGGSQPHDNHQPLLCVSFIISLFGIFPSRS